MDTSSDGHAKMRLCFMEASLIRLGVQLLSYPATSGSEDDFVSPAKPGAGWEWR